MRLFLRTSALLSACLSLAACGGGSTPPEDGGGMDAAGNDLAVPESGTDAGTPDMPSTCTAALQCSDGVFCNGAERCAPGASGADARGCIPGALPCAAGQTCDEGMSRCTTACATTGDADGDGHNSTDCHGDDCDDSDPNRYPGNTEVCDASNHDEDCDPATFGYRDLDMDGSPDQTCCNSDAAGAMHCGTDCNDAAAGTHPSAPEVCDLVDNNCNGMVDEGVVGHFYVDADGDSFGSAADTTGMAACFLPPGYSVNHTDCNDADPMINPAAREICDSAIPAVDENCDGVVNPVALCSCTGVASRGCAEPGACSSGTENCVSGAWSMCSIAPTTETCNAVDDDCNGIVDDGLRVPCYADADNDGYAPAGALMTNECSTPGREALGGCPPTFTNRAPGGTNIDCNDAASSIHPGGMEICIEGAPPVDENCNALFDEGVGVDCYADNDDDTYAPSTASIQHKCIDTSRPTVGGCPFRFTNRVPVGMGIDCDDAHPTAHPGGIEVCDAAMVDEDCNGVANPLPMCMCATGAMRMCPDPGRCAAGTQTCNAGAWGTCSITPIPEICNGMDDDCDGTVDNGVQTICYTDGDGDGYAPAGATSSGRCGACLSNTTDRAPTGMNVDCNDAMMTVHPGASELCDRIDNDCSSGGGAATAEDFDNDGHTASTYAGCAGGTFPRDDCNDGMSTVHPGQMGWFTTGYCPSTGCGPSGVCGTPGACTCCLTGTPIATSFDYNCDGAGTPHPADAACMNGPSTCFPTCGLAGFSYATAPACGAAAAWTNCSCYYDAGTGMAVACGPTSGSPHTLSCH